MDGSFATYAMTVDYSISVTSYKLITRNHGTLGSDYDYWEFTCFHAIGDN